MLNHPSSKCYKLGPSYLTFLWDECPYCFYMKVVHDLERPRQIFPSIFAKFDSQMKKAYAGQSTALLSPFLPKGEVLSQSKRVTSATISFPDIESTAYIYGAFDAVIRFDDSSYGVVDYKTAAPSPHQAVFYARQLNAYAYALEHPAQGSMLCSPISRLGLLFTNPTSTIKVNNDTQGNYNLDLTYLDVLRSEQQFLKLIHDILIVLDNPMPPIPPESCPVCTYFCQRTEKTHSPTA